MMNCQFFLGFSRYFRRLIYKREQDIFALLPVSS